MSGNLQKELKQRKPFSSLEHEVVLNIMRTAGAMRQGTTEALKPYDLTPPQFNVLRILRGAEPEGLPCSDVGDRLVSKDPDVTRLLDRLEKRGLIERGRSATDRRVVTATITTKGIDLVNELDAPITELHASQLGHMKKKELKKLVTLLEKARSQE
ncbi:MAG TPA: MarR family transcriptional regulator [Gemmatimonadaceae bacterium]|nr:MarR family transcriptional regulator [Gemmatimonadaceae bacterium]